MSGGEFDWEDTALLAVNTLLLQIFTLFSYMNDGFAYAAGNISRISTISSEAHLILILKFPFKNTKQNHFLHPL